MPNDPNIPGGMQLNCPACMGVMDRLDLGSYSVDRCPGCGGIWLDVAELDRVRAVTGAVQNIDAGRPMARGPGETRMARLCPRDRTRLEQRRDASQPHVVVDRCPTCLGVFLDAGELKDLARHTLAERIRGFFSGWRA